MNPEELKLILDAIKDVSSDAMPIAIMYVGKGYFAGLIAVVIVSIIAYTIYRIFKPFYNETRWVERVMDAAGKGSYTPNDYKIDEICSLIRKAIENE